MAKDRDLDSTIGAVICHVLHESLPKTIRQGFDRLTQETKEVRSTGWTPHSKAEKRFLVFRSTKL
jgi:hypothetical protein